MSYGREVGQYHYDGIRKVWVVRLENAENASSSWFDCDTQYEAEILSRLVKLERILSKRTS